MPSASVTIPARKADLSKLIHHSFGIWGFHLEARLTQPEIRAMDRVELKRIPSLGIGIRVCFGLQFGQPSPDSAGGRLTWHPPGANVVSPACTGKSRAKLIYSETVIRERNEVAGSRLTGFLIEIITTCLDITTGHETITRISGFRFPRELQGPPIVDHSGNRRSVRRVRASENPADEAGFST